MTEKRRNTAKKTVDTTSLQKYLDTLGLVRPTIHVNGPSYPTAVVTIDLGSPLDGVKLQSEQSQEMVAQLRRLTRDMFKDNVNVRVSFDNNNGICWASVA